MRDIELLAPAGTADIAIDAIRHGADAVYIGAPSHGARKSASNSLEDIRRAVDFAHIFNAKVYVTVNTIIYEEELKSVERMIRELYTIGVDALIIQDMGILRMDIPPIALHASTQCDIRTPEKARFLQEAGFSQLVLARELSVSEITNICQAVTIPVETFVHGALCVSFSGRCGAGFACGGRSGNRGECPQVCRQTFTLKDAKGKILAKDKYLLSLKDFRAETYLEQLIDAGVSSFKIEGRLKEAGYVKNVTSYYSHRLNEIINKSEDKYERTSFGTSKISFVPNLEKSFNRGFTDYRLSGNTDSSGIASILTPKSLGEPVKNISDLRAGDGISYLDRNGIYNGVLVNGIRNDRIIGNRPFKIPENAEIRRTSSVEWKKTMAGDTATRKLSLDISMDDKGISAIDESGTQVRIILDIPGEKAIKPTDYRKAFEKLGNTPFQLQNFENWAPDLFFPVSVITSLRRKLISQLLSAKKINYKFDYRKSEKTDYPYISSTLDYRDNVSNRLAESFYHDHGVTHIEPALEIQGINKNSGKTMMTSKHCVLRELGLCLKNNPGIALPLTLTSGKNVFRPLFRCRECEMDLIYI